ncbi:MAG TPA: hypothetical protein VIA62_12455 [Thermoanaerobaculia bacterium]|jgi:hypothetical protein|nr:hypothetical protein [Thermoanaerobaculia bacterium]
MKAKKQKKEASKPAPRVLEDKDLKAVNASMSACVACLCEASTDCAC